ncbi:hypothetical protein VTK26DRAFT_5981 [Humicola hyalothermophila]
MVVTERRLECRTGSRDSGICLTVRNLVAGVVVGLGSESRTTGKGRKAAGTAQRGVITKEGTCVKTSGTANGEVPSARFVESVISPVLGRTPTSRRRG